MAKPSPVSSASEDALVAADLRAAVAGSTLVSVPSVLLGGAIFLALLYPVTPTARLFGWYGLFVALEVVSGTDTWLTRRRHGGEVGRAWYLRHVAMAAATGTLWGVIPMLPDHGVAEATDWAMVLAGLSVVAAGGMVSSAPKVSMWIAFAVPMFTLSSFAIARWYPADNRVLMAVGLLVVGGVMTAYHSSAHRVFVEAIRLRHRTTALAELLAHEASHDPLTGLANRTALFERATSVAAAARTAGHGYGFVFIDLDKFKDINDRHGHATGDHILTTTAQRIRSAVRPHDIVARFGGDEFVVLLDHTPDTTQPLRIAERLLAAVNAPVTIDDTSIPVGASVGLAWSDHGHDDPGDLLDSADTAMYRTKLEGRGRLTVFDRDLQRAVDERHELENALRHAIVNDEIIPWAQPVVALTDGTPRSVELLARWRRDDGSLVSPAMFIPVAEETGLVVDIGRLMLDHAGQLLDTWAHDPTRAHLKVAVNVSARHLLGGLADDVAAICHTHPAAPGRLVVELTETEFTDDTQQAAETFRRLAWLGVGVAIDDFGTGYSSLAYLHALPATTVKIDKIFVDGAGHDAGATAIVRAVTELGHAYGRAVIAEGVETEHQATALRSLGVEEAQGYLFGRPMPLDELDTWLTHTTTTHTT